MDLKKQLDNLMRDSFNGQITIPEFEKRVQTYAETYHALQLLQTDVSGQSEQFYCFNVKFSDSPHKCIKQCEICRPKNI